MCNEVIGVDPKNGTLKWRFPVETSRKENVMMPMLVGENKIMVRAAKVKTRCIEIVKSGNDFTAKEAWLDIG